MEIISKNKSDTAKIAKMVLTRVCKKKHRSACVVGLHGELGAGKTTFVQAIAKELGIRRKINSPTFLIFKRYSIKYQGFKNIFHVDAYRLKKDSELLHLGWEEIVANPKNLVFIEWPENVKKIMPKKYSKIFISHLDKNSRQFQIKI